MTSEHELAPSSSNAPADDPPGGTSLPPPARTGARIRLAALLALGLGCLLTAWQLRGSAAYALTGEGPRDLGNLAEARLDATELRGAWVRGVGQLEQDAVAFERRGESGSLLLGRVADRKDLWVLLPVPAGTPHYFPPRVLEGRLLSRRAMGLRLRPVVSLMQARGSGDADHLLVVGSRPAEHKTDLILLLLLTSLGLLASVRFALLALPARSATAAS